MKEHPIIFSGEMVRAILEGRKTQTRRVVKPQPEPVAAGFDLTFAFMRTPYGVAGDRLWVRETFVLESNRGVDNCENYPPPFMDGRPVKFYEDFDYGKWWEQPHYAATDAKPELSDDDKEDGLMGWQPSIHMPRWASRITLEIVTTRVERVQDICHTDALAEGVSYDVSKPDGSPIERFKNLWDSINAKRGYEWNANPFVWIIGFKRIT